MTAAWLFVYGSLVSVSSAAGTLGRHPVPPGGRALATLTGYRRVWNVGSNHESHPERVLTMADGRRFTGTLAVLGLVADAGAECGGALYRLSPADLDLLAVRERNYTLVEVSVTATTRRPGRAEPGERTRAEPALTWLPLPAACARLAAARAGGSAVVQRSYVRRVERAFAGLGPGRLAEFRRTTTPHGLPERLIETR